MLKNSTEIKTLFFPLLQGDLKLDENQRTLIYQKWDGIDTPLGMSSALAGEISGLLLTSISMDDNGIMLIEEPEAQLHPYAQFLMGLLLLCLVGIKGFRIVATTHSDTLIQAISIVMRQKPNSNQIFTILLKLLNKEFDNKQKNILKKFALYVSRSIKKIDVKTYYYDSKDIKPIAVESLTEHVPSITDQVIENIIDWGISISYDK